MSIKDNFPSVGPSLSLNFARSKTLDPRITFSRASSSGDATYMNGNGLIVTAAADEPRFDHRYENGVVKSLGLLVEEQRTNLILYSNDFSQSNWTKQNSHPTPSKNAIGPDGVANSASTVYRTATNQYLYQQIVGGGTYTLSAWVKSEAATGSFTMQGYNATDTEVGQVTHTATNEWQRFETTMSPTTNTNYYPCIPTNINTNFYVWGVQVESGSFKTSYIPTTSSTKTRSKDSVSMTGTNFSDWYNPSESTFLVSFRQIYDASSTVPPSTKHILQAGNDTTVNDNYTIRSGQTSTNWSSLVRSASPSSLQFPGIVGFGYLNSSTLYKAALSVNSSLISVSLNGLLNADITNTTTVNHTTPFNKLFIGSGTGGLPPYELSGHISQLAYYPKRLTNTQLQNLTK